MVRLFRATTFGAAVSVLVAACGSGPGALVGPSPLTSGQLALAPSAMAVPSGGRTHGERLTAIHGTGSGIVNVTPTAAVDGSFSAQINVAVHSAPPNTTFYVQRAPEIGRANGADGVCQRAAGAAPWGPPAPNFVTFPLPDAGPLVTLQTSDGGAATVHIDFAAGAIADGTAFDVMFRLVDDLTAPANELRTGCFTVVVK